jgi:hypothetical protein
MKRKIKIIAFMFVIGLVTFTVATGQDKKTEQKIKIIINDGSGTKVVIDTLITDGHMQDSITLKDGKVIFIGHTGDEHGIKHSDNKDQVYVFVSSDDNPDHAKEQTITVVSSDSAIWSEKGESGKVIVMSNLHHSTGTGNVQYKVISTDSKGSGESVDKIIYINEGDAADNVKEKHYDMYIDHRGDESAEYSIRSIIAKDGMVVTVEGNDEAKVKELVKEIQKKMGVNPPESEMKETTKTETKKATKK